MKKTIVLLIVSATVMLAFPWLTVRYAGFYSFMTVCFILFFAVNPICSVTVGVFAGECVKKLWWLPVATALLYLAGAWAFLELWETAFIMYALCYLVIGIVSMAISALVRKKLKKDR